MGIDLAALQLLCCAKSLGVDFSDTVMIGRQTVFCDMTDLSATLASIGIRNEAAKAIRPGEFGETLFKLLGASRVSSLDASDYEQPNYICDLNLPCPGNLSKRFTLVYDGGSLEHVFNAVQGFKSCMEMVQVGGTFIQQSVANNFMGHGFWQLSPETCFRIFSPENGYSLKAVFLCEGGKNRDWYQVDDPATVGSRIELVNNRQTYICTIAQRTVDKEIFAKYPMQSDYTKLWNDSAPDNQRDNVLRREHGATWDFLRRSTPAPIKKAIRYVLNAGKKTPSPFDRPYYHRISTKDFISGRIAKLNG